MFLESRIFIFTIFLVFTVVFEVTESNLFQKQKQKQIRRSQARTLLFPPTVPTRLQFIAGIGIPVEDLAFEAVTSGYVLKAEYFLPETADKFTRPILNPQTIDVRRSARQVMNATKIHDVSEPKASRPMSPSFGSNLKNQHIQASTYRWVVYKAIEVALDSSGLPGRKCLLRSICEHAAAPLHYGGGILAELLHILLTPSTSQDKILNISDNTYYNAEHYGRLGKNCESIFRNCTKSPMDLITAVIDLDSFLF